MSPRRILGEHFKRNGKPKRAYESRAAAIDQGNPGFWAVYRCKFCGAWHRAHNRRS
jgi:hypothetical protein